MILGANLALFLIFIFEFEHPSVAYLLLAGSAILGGAAFFKTDEFFAYFS